MIELIKEESLSDISLIDELTETVDIMLDDISTLENISFFKNPKDFNSAIITIHAGAGGTESCDWADILMRMYLRWSSRHNYLAEIQNVQPGEEAGISHATIRISGDYAYGYIKSEHGIHRLVRISPFDSNQKRHTSFCSVDVIAEIEDNSDLNIHENEIRIDTYCASGKGGQHVNRTESAVRIIHLPTNITAICQNERSQYKNKNSAMKTLKSRLYQYQKSQMADDIIKDTIGWGNQIRNYILQPHQTVKDLRTGIYTSNVQSVLDGNIDLFINAWLRKRN